MSDMFPSQKYRYTLKKGLQGHDVWALQLNLNEQRDYDLVEDGDFGSMTESAVKKYQVEKKLVPDGIAGPITQRTLSASVAHRPTLDHDLPFRLLKGLIEGESGYFVGCVNWDAPGGVDCGWIQDRVLDREYEDDNRWRIAFGKASMENAADQLRAQKDRYRTKNAVLHPPVGSQIADFGDDLNGRAWSLAVLYHNWPWGAERLANGYVLAEYPVQWVVDIGVPGVTSSGDWARHYVATKTLYVKTWTD